LGKDSVKIWYDNKSIIKVLIYCEGRGLLFVLSMPDVGL